jgi:hypothetical protein
MPYGCTMDVGVATGWGVVGGACVEALWLYSRIRSDLLWSWRRPIPQGLTAYIISFVARIGVAAGVAAAAAGSGQVSGPLAAFGLGVGAPLVVEKLSRAIPVVYSGTGKEDAQSKRPPTVSFIENADHIDIGTTIGTAAIDSSNAETSGVSDAG